MPEDSNQATLVDIREVSVDTRLPKHERIAEFLRQIRNPYQFKCGDYTIIAVFNPEGPTLEQCLERIVSF